MIRIISKIVLVRPNETVDFTVSLRKKVADYATFSIESANPGGYWGSSIDQIPADTVVPDSLIVMPTSGIVHEDEPEKKFTIKYLYETWIRVVQYIPLHQPVSITAKIKVNTQIWTRIKRFWLDLIVERPTERIF